MEEHPLFSVGPSASLLGGFKAKEDVAALWISNSYRNVQNYQLDSSYDMSYLALKDAEEAAGNISL
jgi:hypothetical protein